jgi:DNA-binding MarR family transcriptional regulator
VLKSLPFSSILAIGRTRKTGLPCLTNKNTNPYRPGLDRHIHFPYFYFMANKMLILNNREYTDEERALRLMLSIAQDYHTEMVRSLAHLGISPLQVNILNSLVHAPKERLTVNQLKTLQVDDNPNVSRALNKLMKNELIRKKRSNRDQRVVQIRLTEKGRAMHEMAHAAMVPVLKLPLGRKDTGKLLELLLQF